MNNVRVMDSQIFKTGNALFFEMGRKKGIPDEILEVAAKHVIGFDLKARQDEPINCTWYFNIPINWPADWEF